MPTWSSSADARFRRSAAGVAEECPEVLEQLFGRQVIVEVRVLRQVPDSALDLDVAHRPAEDLRAAGRRKDELHEQLQRRGLTRAVRTEEAEDLALADLEGQAVERPVGPRAPESDRVVLGKGLGPYCVHRAVFSCVVGAGFSRPEDRGRITSGPAEAGPYDCY